jgi:hypothetical protein
VQNNEQVTPFQSHEKGQPYLMRIIKQKHMIQ